MYDLLYEFYAFIVFSNNFFLSWNYAWNVLFAILSLLISATI